MKKTVHLKRGTKSLGKRSEFEALVQVNQTLNHSETTARSKFQKNKEKSLVNPSGGGETAGTLVYLSVCLSASLKRQLFCNTSSIFALDSVKNETILRDCLNFWTWQHQKWNNSARLPSIMESWVQSWRPCTTASCDFSSPCFWSIAPARKKWCQAIRSAAPVTQKHLPKTEDLMLQNATLLKKSAPWPPNISDEHVSCTAPATRKCIFPDPLQMFRVCHLFRAC